MNGSGARALRDMVRDQKRGEPRGIWSVCSANPFVLEAAMEEARAQGGGVLAGYEKIHLDASMACADDPGGAGGPLDERTVAERTAELAGVAEAAAAERGGAGPVYVVGTEVPTPGGEQETVSELAVTRPEAALRFLELVRGAFGAKGLERAWERVIALVVQPGVEFGDDTVHAYDRSKARALKEAIESVPGVVYEAHSTDYQTTGALRRLVEDHFAIQGRPRADLRLPGSRLRSRKPRGG